MPSMFSCETCSKTYNHNRSLNIHCKQYLEPRKSQVAPGNGIATSADAVHDFLSVSAFYRRSRLRKLVKELNNQEIEVLLTSMSVKTSRFVYFMAKVNDKPNQEIYSVLRNFLLSVSDKFAEPIRRYLEFMGYERNNNVNNARRNTNIKHPHQFFNII